MVFYKVKRLGRVEEAVFETQSEKEAVDHMENGFICEVHNRFADGSEEFRYFLKYTLEPTDNPELFKLKCLLPALPGGIKYGEYGGLVSDKKVLSHTGNCWIWPNATVKYGTVKDNACIRDNAVVKCSEIYGNAVISGDAEVSFCKVFDDARVGLNTNVRHYDICGKSEIMINGELNSLDPINYPEIRDIVFKIEERVNFVGFTNSPLAFTQIIPGKTVILAKYSTPDRDFFEREMLAVIVEDDKVFMDISDFEDYLTDEYGNLPGTEKALRVIKIANKTSIRNTMIAAILDYEN